VILENHKRETKCNPVRFDQNSSERHDVKEITGEFVSSFVFSDEYGTLKTARQLDRLYQVGRLERFAIVDLAT
jgi:hypothetical protein